MYGRTPKTGILIAMIDQLETGYYAVQADPMHPHIDFVRVSRMDKEARVNSRWRGAVKVQTIHAEDLIERWAYWPDRDLIYIGNNKIEDILLRLLANKRAAMRLYAEEIGRCCRCNTQLTDERSRHYSFGPECEKHLEGLKDEIDDERGGTYEDLLARGELV
jgi:hypothetical protein